MKNSISQSNKCKVLLVSSLLLLAIGISFAQNERKDSLVKHIEKTKTIENTLDIKVPDAEQKANVISKKDKKKPTRNSDKSNGIENGFLFKRYSIKSI